MAMQPTQEAQIRGDFATSDVTHVLEAVRLEGQNYLKNHMLMQLCGTENGIREWHDNVTKRNLEVFKPLVKEMGIDLPFPKPLEERENEIKQKLKTPEARSVLTQGEALAMVKTTAMHLLDFYSMSMAISVNEKGRDAFRRAFENVADAYPKIEQQLKGTDAYYPPPLAQKVGLLAKKGTPVR